MDLQLTGRAAVVTGASKGIGLEIVRTLLEEGARVVAASRTTTPALEELGSGLVHVEADLTEPRAPAEIVARAVADLGGIDVLVNNVGGAPPGVSLPRASFLDGGDEDWAAVIELNLLTAVRACRAAIPVMIDGGGGSIVNVSSANARRPTPSNVDYSAAKAAMSSVGKALAEEFGPQGIRVNTVSPGPVLTPWWTHEGGAADNLATLTGADRGQVTDTLVPELMGLSTGRMADPREVADAVAVLASPRSASTNGAELAVDSGLLKQL